MDNQRIVIIGKFKWRGGEVVDLSVAKNILCEIVILRVHVILGEQGRWSDTCEQILSSVISHNAR